jgi:hypothetical protein
MSTWEERMAAKAAARRAERDGIARAAEELRRAEEERQEAAWVATLPPCPCALDPCPYPPRRYDSWWEWHRRWWTELRRTGQCPDCGRPVTPQEAVDHDCPNQVVLAG